jgi:hypothetical protein
LDASIEKIPRRIVMGISGIVFITAMIFFSFKKMTHAS